MVQKRAKISSWVVFFIFNTAFPTNRPSVFHIEMTWKRPFPYRFNVENTRFVCRVVTTRCFWTEKLTLNNASLIGNRNLEQNIKRAILTFY